MRGRQRKMFRTMVEEDTAFVRKGMVERKVARETEYMVEAYFEG